MAKNKIYIIDVTNRDGVQTSRICLSKLQKTMINLYLNEMGIYQICSLMRHQQIGPVRYEPSF